MPKAVTENEYSMAARDYIGWCTSCGEFTRDCTEPDAEEYDCPKCEQNTVMGAEQALLVGHITFKEEQRG